MLLTSMCELFLGVSTHTQIHSLGSERQGWTAQENFVSILMHFQTFISKFAFVKFINKFA